MNDEYTQDPWITIGTTRNGERAAWQWTMTQREADIEERVREIKLIKHSEGTLRSVLGSNERMERVAALMRSDPLGRGDYTRQDVLVLMEALSIEAQSLS